MRERSGRPSGAFEDSPASVAIYQAAFEASSNAVFIADGQGRYVAANRRAIELTGYTRAALIGMTRGDLTPAGDHSLRRQDDSRVAVEIQLHPLPGGHTLEVITDVSWREAYEAVQDSEKRYRSLVESVLDPMFTSDGDGRYLYVNAAAAAMLGTTPDQVVGKRAHDFFPPQIAEVYCQGAKEVIETGKNRVVVDRAEIAGQTKWFDTVVQPMRNRDGQITAVQGVVRDITARKLAEDALRQSEERLRQAVRVSSIGIFDHDHLTDALYWSPELRAIHGVGADEPIVYHRKPDGSPSQKYLPHPDDRERINAAVLKAHDPKGDGLFDVEYRVQNRDGGYRWVTVRSLTLFEGEGDGRHPIRTVGAVRDITSLKEAERALSHNEDRLRQVVDVAHIGVFEHDHVARTMYLSPSMREFVGLGLNETVPGARYQAIAENPPTYLNTIHPDDRARVAAKIEQAHREGGLYEEEHRLVRPDGTVRWITVRSRTTIEGEGDARRPVRTVGAMSDITERKLADEEREKLQMQLVQAQKMESVGRLAGGIAHDFNNMLNVICGYAEMLRDQLNPRDPFYKPVDGICKAGRRSSELTASLLAFARKQAVAPRVLDLNECIERSLDIVQRLIGEDVRPVWEPGRDLWSVRMDPVQIDQILMNLAANARDAIQGVGRLTLHTRNVAAGHAGSPQLPEGAAGDFVMLEVSDDGRGMDAETKRHLFEPFFTTKTEGLGTGLGLATVYGIVTQNGGHIAVRSEVNQGTTVTIFLPRSSGDTTPIAPAPPPAVAERGSETVLLVEDEPMVLDLSQNVLEGLGYTVIPAHSPREALRVVRTRGHEVDLLLTDVVMPEMHGPELARQLLATCPRLKCLFVSAYFAEAGSMQSAIPERTDVLRKPFSASDLALRVRRALDEA